MKNRFSIAPKPSRFAVKQFPETGKSTSRSIPVDYFNENDDDYNISTVGDNRTILAAISANVDDEIDPLDAFM